ncbi:VanZ family protein [Neobacillus sp.]|uniref:VanZ family protein n=1 Tax=Neobacillus sp. TaxID=2675273 RepID=UPI002898C1E1|nr:VanZ family protein [Neobacillus sp.]
MTHYQIQSSRSTNNKKPQKHILFMKITLVVFWGIFLLLSTWTENLEQLLDLQSVGFSWVSKPDLLSFFYFNDLTLIHPDYLIVKLGHFIGFAVMDLLLFNLIKSHKFSIGLSISLALLTEILQLFFGRDGRLYDLVIDSLGVLLVFFILKKLKL